MVSKLFYRCLQQAINNWMASTGPTHHESKSVDMNQCFQKASASTEKALLDIWYIVEQDKGEEGGGVGSWPQEPSSGGTYNILHIFCFQRAACTNQFTDKTIQWKKKKRKKFCYTLLRFTSIEFSLHINIYKIGNTTLAWYILEREREKKYKLKSKEHFSWPHTESNPSLP